MEIDFPPTSSWRSVDRKRARSPTSQPPFDRPTKRASGFNGMTPSVPNCQHQIPQTKAESYRLPSAFLESRTPDDWVVKTGGLRLNGPSFSLGHVPLPDSERWNVESTAENTIDGAHEIVMADHDVNNTAMETRPFLSTGSNVSSPFNASCTTRAPFPSSLPLAASQVALASQPRDIHVYIQPATPSIRILAQSAITSSSPLPKSTATSNTPARKSRITMGPRPDCEKCRMGVKGHWMHVD